MFFTVPCYYSLTNHILIAEHTFAQTREIIKFVYYDYLSQHLFHVQIHRTNFNTSLSSHGYPL